MGGYAASMTPNVHVPLPLFGACHGAATDHVIEGGYVERDGAQGCKSGFAKALADWRGGVGEGAGSLA